MTLATPGRRPAVARRVRRSPGPAVAALLLLALACGLLPWRADAQVTAAPVAPAAAPGTGPPPAPDLQLRLAWCNDGLAALRKDGRSLIPGIQVDDDGFTNGFLASVRWGDARRAWVVDAEYRNLTERRADPHLPSDGLRRWDTLRVRAGVARSAGSERASSWHSLHVGGVVSGDLGGLRLQSAAHELGGLGDRTAAHGLQRDYPGGTRLGATLGAAAGARLDPSPGVSLRAGAEGQLAVGATGLRALGASARLRLERPAGWLRPMISADLEVAVQASDDPWLALPGGYRFHRPFAMPGATLGLWLGPALVGWQLVLNRGGGGQADGVVFVHLGPELPPW